MGKHGPDRSRQPAARRPLGNRGSGKPLEGPSAALGQEDVAMAPCHTERRSLSCLEREPRRESEHGVQGSPGGRVSMGFGSAAGLTSAFGARAGEESGAGSGQPWEEHATGSSGPRRTSPRGSRVARASSPFSRKKPTPQASVRNFLTKTGRWFKSRRTQQ